MTRRYLALCCWLLCLFTLAGCVSPFREVDRVGEYTPEIDPQAGTRSGAGKIQGLFCGKDLLGCRSLRGAA